ncbi:MAG: hypothetical protein M0031_03895 [Thermaerobacter sp.]|nr:hypothetical protein [Thermaerobacter sp.]
MARSYLLWANRGKQTKAVVGCGMLPLYRRDEQASPAKWWERQDPAVEKYFPLSGDWELLLRLLNMERQIQPPSWSGAGSAMMEWHKLNAGLPFPDWDMWKLFALEAEGPYLLTDDQEHPLLWFPGTDGEWYGFLFNFGLIPGQWHWWVPGMERVESDPGTGRRMIIMGEAHSEEAAGKTIRDLLGNLPLDLFKVDTDRFLSLQEALEIELRRHSQKEIDRCRFVVYRAQRPVHSFDGEPYALQMLETLRQDICQLAWTLLSPHIPFFDAHLRSVLAGNDPNVMLPATAEKIKAMPTEKRLARIIAHLGTDPLAPLLARLEKTVGAVSAGEARIMPELTRVARSRDPREREEAEAARRQMIEAAQLREECRTTDVFAAAAQQLEWAVEAGKKLRSCPHPGCGKAFLTDDLRRRYCPEHRDERVRSQRHRLLKQKSREDSGS